MAEMTAAAMVEWLTSDKAFGQECYSRKQIADLIQQQAATIESANARVAEMEKDIEKNLLSYKISLTKELAIMTQRAEAAEAQCDEMEVINTDLCADNKRMREALEDLLESPYVLSEATIPKGGVDVAPEQVVGIWHVGLIKYRNAKAALEGKA